MKRSGIIIFCREKWNLWIFPIQQAGQNTGSILLLLGLLQLFMIVSTTDNAGCPNLLCHRLKIIEEYKWRWSSEEEDEEAEEEFEEA